VILIENMVNAVNTNKEAITILSKTGTIFSKELFIALLKGKRSPNSTYLCFVLTSR
jgi:hypothetical protein